MLSPAWKPPSATIDRWRLPLTRQVGCVNAVASLALPSHLGIVPSWADAIEMGIGRDGTLALNRLSWPGTRD